MLDNIWATYNLVVFENTLQMGHIWAAYGPPMGCPYVAHMWPYVLDAVVKLTCLFFFFHRYCWNKICKSAIPPPPPPSTIKTEHRPPVRVKRHRQRKLRHRLVADRGTHFARRKLCEHRIARDHCCTCAFFGCCGGQRRSEACPFAFFSLQTQRSLSL